MDEKRLGHACILSASTEEESAREALRLAQAMLCRSSGRRPCGRCEACRKAAADIHPDLITVRREKDDNGRLKQNVTVDQIRAVFRDASVLPNEAAHKIYVIREADRMNLLAQNAALKLLEEPPNGAVFLLCTTNPGLLLPTVRSRCTEYRSAAPVQAAEGDGAPAEDYLRAAASGDRAQLLRWCAAQEGLDQRETAALIESLRGAAADALCGRRSAPGLSRRQLSEIAALCGRCADYLRVNTGSKHIIGLLGADTPLGSGNRG